MAEKLVETVSSPKASTQVSQPSGFIDRGGSLPESYGQTRIVLLPRDPYWMYTYWEVNEQAMGEIKQKFGNLIFQTAQAVLRMNEVSAQDQTLKILRFYDVPTSLDAKNWYLNADKEASSWFVELGLKTMDGQFIKIAQSNVITLPAGRVSDLIDEKWATVKEELEKVLEASGGGRVGIGSLEIAKMLSQRWLSLAKQVSSWKGGASISSRFGQAPYERKRQFWFIADCELVVYGATEPTAAVTVQDKPIELMPDGTFSMRFALPDGKLNIPIKAVSGDQLEERWVELSVERKTQAGQSVQN